MINIRISASNIKMENHLHLRHSILIFKQLECHKCYKYFKSELKYFTRPLFLPQTKPRYQKNEVYLCFNILRPSPMDIYFSIRNIYFTTKDLYSQIKDVVINGRKTLNILEKKPSIPH